jgi:tetratricopeptide (TPR) repeat protein
VKPALAIGLAAALLAGWGAVKIPWEQKLGRDRNHMLLGQDMPLNYSLRDNLGQGLTLAALGGFRGVAANFIWLDLTEAWEEQEWSRVHTNAELAVLLQPRVLFFWDNGAWYLAWNASISSEKYSKDPNPDRRRREALGYVEAGREMLERGIRVNPEKPQLYERLAFLYEQRLQDYENAARYYKLAAAMPGVPTYMERFAGYALEKAGKPREAYEYWLDLWHSSPDHPPKNIRQWEKIESHIRKLENKLEIPDEKRIFAKRAGIPHTSGQ